MSSTDITYLIHKSISLYAKTYNGKEVVGANGTAHCEREMLKEESKFQDVKWGLY
jgi:hypothetical protein